MKSKMVLDILENIESSHINSINECIKDNNYSDIYLFKDSLKSIQNYKEEFINDIITNSGKFTKKSRKLFEKFVNERKTFYKENNLGIKV
jgi:hypothetical protein